jgi:hypothetical protein
MRNDMSLNIEGNLAIQSNLCKKKHFDPSGTQFAGSSGTSQRRKENVIKGYLNGL